MLNWKLILISILLLIFAGCSQNQDIKIDKPFEVEQVDQTTPIGNIYLSKTISQINLTENLTIGQKTYTIESNVAPQIGNLICLKHTNGNAYTQDYISNVTSLGGNDYRVTTKIGVDFAYTIDDGCSIRSNNMGVDGSTTPQIFSISALGLNESVKWHIKKIICLALGDGVNPSNTKPDSTSFLTMAANNNGIHLIAVNGNMTKNIFYANSNAELERNFYSIRYIDKNVGGLYAVGFEIDFDSFGTVIELSANESDNSYHSLEMHIEKNLLDINSYECKVQFHEIDDYLALLYS